MQLRTAYIRIRDCKYTKNIPSAQPLRAACRMPHGVRRTATLRGVVAQEKPARRFRRKISYFSGAMAIFAKNFLTFARQTRRVGLRLILIN